MRWKKEEINSLKEKYEKREYIKDIASDMKRSIRSVQHKVLRSGFSRSPVRLKKLNKKTRRETDSKYYKIHKEDIVKRRREKIRKEKEELIKSYGGRCSKCGYNKCNSALEFHHIKKDKESSVTILIGHASKSKVLKEAKKCILLCANCHRELHTRGS